MNNDDSAEKLATVGDVATEVAALRDRLDILQLPVLYCHCVRRRDADGLVQLFTVDGTFSLDGSMGPKGLFTGADLRNMYKQGLPDLDPWPLTHNLYVVLDGPSSATGRVHVEFRLGSQGYRVTHLGLYEDDYLKEDGVWKFQHRKLTATPVA